MPFQVNDKDGVAVFAISGKFLGSLEGDAFRQALESLKNEGRTKVIVDLSKADFMDSTAIGLLIGGLTTMRRDGGDIRLAGMEKRIKNIFLLTRLLGPVFTDYDDVAAAVASYNAEG